MYSQSQSIFRFVFEIVRYFAKNEEFGVQACLYATRDSSMSEFLERVTLEKLIS